MGGGGSTTEKGKKRKGLKRHKRAKGEGEGGWIEAEDRKRWEKSKLTFSGVNGPNGRWDLELTYGFPQLPAGCNPSKRMGLRGV